MGKNKDWNLSEKIIIGCGQQFKDNYQDTNVKKCTGEKWFICDSCKIRKKLAEDIKEFIKRLKEFGSGQEQMINEEWIDFINTLAGEELVGVEDGK